MAVYTDCVSGQWYGFGDLPKFIVGQNITLQWGVWEDTSTPVNLYVDKPGGSLIESLFLNAAFSTENRIYHIYNSSSTCELNQVNVTIPNDLGVAINSSEVLQFGIFNGSIGLGEYGDPLLGFLSWSPFFEVWNNVTSTATAMVTVTVTPSASTTAKAMAIVTPSSTILASPVVTTPSNGNSGSLSSSTKAVIGVSASVGGVILVISVMWAWLWNRRKRRSSPAQFTESHESRNPTPRKSLEYGMFLPDSGPIFASQYETAQNPTSYKPPDDHPTTIIEMSTSRQRHEMAARTSRYL